MFRSQSAHAGVDLSQSAGGRSADELHAASLQQSFHVSFCEAVLFSDSASISA